MASTEATQPIKRRPGRPRKNPVIEPAVKAEPVQDAWKAPDKPRFPSDERIGQAVDDPRWTSIGFDDGRSYRVEGGVIAERVS